MKENRLSRPVSIVLASALVVALAVSALSCRQEGEASERIRVAVSILPQVEFVENVGGERVDVTAMVPPGADPHTYELTPSQMIALARAKMYAKVGSGIEFELVWMDRLIAANRDMLVVDCSRGVQLIKMVGEHAEDGGAKDPHIWLSPRNAQIMVGNICDGLVELDPDNRAYYEQNRDTYVQKLTKLDQDIRDGLSGITNRRFIAYHPAFGYFARDYNLAMVPIEEGGKEPTAADIAHLIQEAGRYNVKVIFASPQFNPQSARVIAGAIGGRVAFIDPVARDYVANLRLVLSELVQAME